MGMEIEIPVWILFGILIMTTWLTFLGRMVILLHAALLTSLVVLTEN